MGEFSIYLLGADLISKHCSPGSSRSPPLAHLTPWRLTSPSKPAKNSPSRQTQMWPQARLPGPISRRSTKQLMGAGGAGLSHWGQRHMAWFAPSSPPASPGGSPASHKPLCGESPKEKGSRSHQLPGAGMHTPRTRVSVVLLSITLDIPGWLLEGSHPLASSYLVSQQTNRSSKPLSSHRGKKKLSASSLQH